MAQALLGYHSEHRWIRFALVNLRGMFRYLPNQPGYHKRLKAAQPLLSKTILMLAEQCRSWFDDTWMTDPAALRDVAGDGQTLGAGRARRLRLLRLALPLLLGA